MAATPVFLLSFLLLPRVISDPSPHARMKIIQTVRHNEVGHTLGSGGCCLFRLRQRCGFGWRGVNVRRLRDVILPGRKPEGDDRLSSFLLGPIATRWIRHIESITDLG
jgi:hypothetical protein